MMDTLVRSRTAAATAMEIARLPHAPASLKAVLFALLNLRGGHLAMVLPDGRVLHFGETDAPEAVLVVHDAGFAKRCLVAGDIGFADGFVAGEWSSPDLPVLLSLLADNAGRIARIFRGNVAFRALGLLRHAARKNTRDGARRNIHEHYDLGNRFYAAWLDSTMSYSAARFDAGCRDLEDAQRRKYHAMAHHLDLKAGDRVLEIGCGWGGFAEIAATQYGARVTAITISAEQHAFTRARIEAAGLADRVEVRLQDYRDVEGQFDKIASIEMFEAVGEAYWPNFFEKLGALLKPNGIAALQIITIRDDLFAQYRARADFIQHYVFPGGMLPSRTRLRDETARAGFAWRGVESFGADYARTLAEWARRFGAADGDIDALGFDARFKRLWRFYLGYCEAGFRTGRTDVIQLGLVKR